MKASAEHLTDEMIELLTKASKANLPHVFKIVDPKPLLEKICGKAVPGVALELLMLVSAEFPSHIPK